MNKNHLLYWILRVLDERPMVRDIDSITEENFLKLFEIDEIDKYQWVWPAWQEKFGDYLDLRQAQYTKVESK